MHFVKAFNQNDAFGLAASGNRVVFWSDKSHVALEPSQ